MNAELTIRELSQRAAAHPRIDQAVNQAVHQALRTELPGVIESILSDMYKGETVRFYVPQHSTSGRRDRDRAIRMKWTGRNARALAAEFKLSIKQIHRIAVGLAAVTKTAPRTAPQTAPRTLSP